MKNRYSVIGVVLVLMAVAFFATPLASDSSDGQKSASGDFDWSCAEEISMIANETKSFTFSVYNLRPDTLHMNVSAGSIESASVSVSNGTFALKPQGESGDRITVTVYVTSDVYADAENEPLVLTLNSYNTSTGVTETETMNVHVVIQSKYGVDSSIGKIMGSFDNPLPSPFDTVIAGAVITLVIWFVLSCLASTAVRYATQYLANWIDTSGSKVKVDRKTFRKTWKYIFGIVIMYGIANTMEVLGLTEDIIGTFRSVTDIVTILFIGMTFWHIFTILADSLAVKLAGEDEQESSLKPLVVLIGRIVIVALTLIGIMRAMNVNLSSLAIALTFATTGISFGAKTLITQFFSGIQIMILRTFRAGDKIKVGNDKTTLIVKEVGIMTTKCKNWSNEEIYFIPNSTLSDSRIINITKNNIFYKVYDYYTISHSSDLNKAKQIMAEVAYDDDEVLSDDVFGKPNVRFEDVSRTDIKLRLAYTVTDHENYGSISARIRKKIFERFVEEGIDIPYPQYTVNIIRAEPKEEAKEEEKQDQQ